MVYFVRPVQNILRRLIVSGQVFYDVHGLIYFLRVPCSALMESASAKEVVELFQGTLLALELFLTSQRRALPLCGRPCLPCCTHCLLSSRSPSSRSVSFTLSLPTGRESCFPTFFQARRYLVRLGGDAHSTNGANSVPWCRFGVLFVAPRRSCRAISGVVNFYVRCAPSF